MERCPPRLHTVPDWSNEQACEKFHRYTTVADLYGFVLMPWQKLALAQLAMPWVYEQTIQVGRQQGKTVKDAVPMGDSLIHHPRHTVVYSAQTGDDANRKIKEEFVPVFEKGGLNLEVGFKFNQSPNGFGLYVTNGAILRSMTGAKESLRGATRVVLGVIDEARSDPDSNRKRVLVPTTTVVDDARIIVESTAGDADSIFFREQLDSAQNSLGERQSSKALIEYGVEPDEDFDPADTSVWMRTLPAIGYTTTARSIKHAYDSMEEHDFCMEYLGLWLSTKADEAVPKDVWKEAQSQKIALTGELTMSVDSPPEQDLTVAVVSDAYGQIELIEVKEGTENTAFEWVCGILDRNDDIGKVAMASSNTLKRTGERLAMRGHEVKWYDTEAMHKAASRFWEAIHHRPRQVAIANNSYMNEANKGAFRWPLSGGGWVFKRQTSEDFASPLIAATMAYDAAVKMSEQAVDDLGDYSKIWDELTKKGKDS